MLYMTVDPGLNGNGVCIGDEKGNIKAIKHFKKRSRTEPKYIGAMIKDGFAFNDLLDEYKPDVVFIEMPEFWGSHKGLTCVRTNALVKLAMLVGVYVAACSIRNIKFELVTPRMWKGNLPKSVVERRVLAMYSRGLFREKVTNHEMDAVGIYISMIKGGL